MTPEQAEMLGLEALGWLAGDDAGRTRFVAVSGVEGDGLRRQAGSPELAVSVLDFLLANEDLLVHFCEDTSTAPRALHQARHLLGG